MAAQSGLPMLSGPMDQMRTGFRNLECEMKAPHPVAALQKSMRDVEWESKLDMVQRTYGSHLAMRLATEKAQCSRHQRQPGLPAGNVNLETVLGTDTKIEFSDFLNLPYSRPIAPISDLHGASEAKCGGSI